MMTVLRSYHVTVIPGLESFETNPFIQWHFHVNDIWHFPIGICESSLQKPRSNISTLANIYLFSVK